MSGARVVSVNVGVPRTTEWMGRRVRSGIWKLPAEGPVELEGDNFVGDRQADLRVHGGPDKAVYAYAVEDYARYRDMDLAPGTFGENLTTEGIDLSEARIGDRWRVGSAVLEVSQPREPCYKLAMRMGDPDFPDRFEAVGRPGAYLRIIEAGAVTAGDAIEVEAASEPAVAVGPLYRGELTDEQLEVALADPRLPRSAQRAVARLLKRNG